VPTTGRSRHLADDGRHLTDPAARFAGIFVDVVNAVSMVTFGVAQHTPGLLGLGMVSLGLQPVLGGMSRVAFGRPLVRQPGKLVTPRCAAMRGNGR
jgi:hypothetical protein